MRSNLPMLRYRRRRAVPLPPGLFSAGEVGFWADVHPSGLWQDTARTTPVVADGDPVASWLLNTSAGGAIYATQSTAGNRPVFKLDASGRGYLEFNGATSNRWLVTPTITPATDKVQVFAGVRKLSDAAFGIIAEVSADVNSNSGSFNLSASPTNVTRATYGLASRGSILVSFQSPATFAAPISNVLTGLGDISGDLAALRLNGTQVAQSTADQGTGNYLAYPIFIGRRAGTSLPFNGRLYGLIVRFGANLDANTISQTETWVNSKTGAY